MRLLFYFMQASRLLVLAVGFCSIFGVIAQLDEVTNLTDDSFEGKIFFSDVPWLVLMCDRVAETCGQASADFDKLKGFYMEKELKLGFLDCDEYPDNCLDFNVQPTDYPTYFLYKRGGVNEPVATARYPVSDDSEPSHLYHWVNHMQHGPVTHLNGLLFSNWVKSRNSVVLFHGNEKDEEGIPDVELEFLRSVMVELSQLSGARYAVGKVNCMTSLELCQGAGVEQIPEIRFYSKDLVMESAQNRVNAFRLEGRKGDMRDAEGVSSLAKDLHEWARELLQKVKSVKIEMEKEGASADAFAPSMAEDDKNDGSTSWFRSWFGSPESDEL